jgi:hypothetical protein
MNVLVRSKRAKQGGRRHSRASAPHLSPRPEDRDTPLETGAPAPSTTAPAVSAETQPRAAAPGRSRHDHLPLQDNALYTCHCGFVFEAAVSTTVGCPHCGTGQAW